MKPLNLLVLSVILCFFSCKTEKSDQAEKAHISGQNITIKDSVASDSVIADYIKPYAEHIDKEMDSVLAHTPEDLDKTNGGLNTAIGNMMADAVMEMANPVFKKRRGRDIDAVLLNYGGIRSTIPAGDITTETAYDIMPFENAVVVVRLNKTQMEALFSYLADHQVAHPIAGMQLVVGENGAIVKQRLGGKLLQENKTYWIATNNYLYRGGDNMTFLGKGDKKEELNYKLRNLFIDYFKKHDTINPQQDQRFIEKI